MLLETLVMTVCLQQQGGCTETTSAYYHHNKDAQAIVHDAEEYGNRLIKGNEWLVYVASPVYSIVVGKPANFHIYKGYMLSIDVKKELVAVQWSY